MPYTPLWTAALSKEKKALSNATVENHFRQVKSSLKRGQRFTITQFVGERFKSIKNLTARIVSDFYFLKTFIW